MSDTNEIIGNSSSLTLEKLEALMRQYPPPPSSPFESLFRPLVPEFAGLKVYEKPPPPPMIQVRDITLDDGTPILSPGFRNRMNAWLLDRFGRQPDSIYFISGLGIAMSKRNMAIIRDITG